MTMHVRDVRIQTIAHPYVVEKPVDLWMMFFPTSRIYLEHLDGDMIYLWDSDDYEKDDENKDEN